MQEHLLTSRLTPSLRQELNSLAFRVSLPGGSTVFQEGNDAEWNFHPAQRTHQGGHEF